MPNTPATNTELRSILSDLKTLFELLRVKKKQMIPKWNPKTYPIVLFEEFNEFKFEEEEFEEFEEEFEEEEEEEEVEREILINKPHL